MYVCVFLLGEFLEKKNMKKEYCVVFIMPSRVILGLKKS